VMRRMAVERMMTARKHIMSQNFPPRVLEVILLQGSLRNALRLDSATFLCRRSSGCAYSGLEEEDRRAFIESSRRARKCDSITSSYFCVSLGFLL
jgi:hypothetical protein